MTIRDLSRAALFAALTAVAAQVTIPLPLVPFTLQTIVTFLSGAILGSRLGALSQAVYVLIGIAGLPVFSGQRGGPGVLIGPTGGYLIGFIMAAYVVGFLYERVHISTSGRFTQHLIGFSTMLLGLIATYIPGVLVLSWHVDTLSEALTIGVIMFLPADVVKTFIAYVIARGLTLRGVVVRPMPGAG